MDSFHTDIGIPFSRICRGCIEERQCMESIFNLNIAEMFTYCTSLMVTEGDGLPGLICTQCIEHVNRLYKFKKLCEKSDSTLKHHVLRGILPPEEILLDNNLYDENVENGNHFIMPVQQPTEDEYLACADSPSVSLEPECNLVENVLAALQDNLSIGEANIDTGEVLDYQEYAPNDLIRYINNNSNSAINTTPFELRVQEDIPFILQPLQFVEEVHKCIQCKKIFSSSHDLTIHNSVHSKTGELQCDVCQKEFLQRSALLRHLRIHMDRKIYDCQYCLKKYIDKRKFDNHIKSHDYNAEGKPCVCSVCGNRYKFPSDLVIHSRTHNGERPFLCPICDKSFTSSKLLNSHLKTHTQEKKYKCTICNKGFVHRSTLKDHKVTHTGKRPYVCSICDSAFTQSSNLSLHMRVHTGSRPYACTTCGRAFTSSSQLKRHMLIHSGKFFHCPICEKSFTRSQDLKQHVRTHTKEKPFACPYCNKNFSASCHRTHHVRTRHGRSTQDNQLLKCSVCNVNNCTIHLKSQKIRHTSFQPEIVSEKDEDIIAKYLNPIVLYKPVESLAKNNL